MRDDWRRVESRSMSGNVLVLELVQQILESDRAPEEICADHPELLWEVRQLLKRAQQVEARLEELFPSSLDQPNDHPLHSALGNDLPEIPGYDRSELAVTADSRTMIVKAWGDAFGGLAGFNLPDGKRTYAAPFGSVSALTSTGTVRLRWAAVTSSCGSSSKFASLRTLSSDWTRSS